MKRTIICVLLASLVMAVACTKEFEEYDRPKTAANQIDPDVLFTRSLVTGSAVSAVLWQHLHQISGSVYAQHWANIQMGSTFTADNYEPVPANTVWDWFFAQANFAPLHYNFHVMKLSREIQNPIKEACARIWNAYMVQQLTDMYGDMPYFEAFVSLKPRFDSQKDIYLHLLKDLSEAVLQIKENQGKGFPGYGKADVLYQGDLNKWVRFGNTLILRIALRASNTPEFISEIRPYLQNLNLAETIESNQHNAQIIPDPNGPTYHVKNPMAFVAGWDEVRLSKTLYDHLITLNDPRLAVFARPNENGLFVGLPNGQPHDSISLKRSTYYIPNYCNIGSFFTRDVTPMYLLTAADAALMKAEAAQKGFIAGSAEQFYNDAIRASLTQFGITDQGIIDDYLAGPARFVAAQALNQIYTQRWIALYPNGHEAWSLVRQTGVPQMAKPVYTYPGNSDMPRRRPYPVNERRYNTANYDAAVNRMGGDSQYTRIWWDGGK